MDLGLSDVDLAVLRQRIAITICKATSGGQGAARSHECECGWPPLCTDLCPDMLGAADAVLAVLRKTHSIIPR